MIRMGFALVLSLLSVLATGKYLIKFLKLQGIGQTTYELGPDHKQKDGTPIMGGFLFIYSSAIFSLILHKGAISTEDDFLIVILVFCVACMLIGFIDDFIKAVKKRNLGLKASQKLIFQTIFAVAFSCYCYFNKNIGSVIYIPFTTSAWDLGVFYIPLMIITIIFIVNSANIQDGMDGLLSSVSIVGFLCWGFIALSYLQMHTFNIGPWASTAYQNIAIFSFAIAGGCMGFLKFNYYPAKTFMGDTGSMYLGAATVAIALTLKQPLLLLLIYITPIASSLSVIIQRIYFRATNGKRLFKMSPIHHHFEKSGMSETQVIMMYTIITTVFSVLAVLSVYGITTTIY